MMNILFLAMLSPLAQQPASADIRVIYWHERDRPLDTFKFQAYDLRKHQYTPEVARWVTTTRQQYPGYRVYTRDVDLKRESGATDNHKIGAAITREFMTLGFQRGAPFLASPATLAPSPLSFRPSRPVAGFGRGQVGAATSPAWSPFPVPYPRPHP